MFTLSYAKVEKCPPFLIQIEPLNHNVNRGEKGAIFRKFSISYNKYTCKKYRYQAVKPKEQSKLKRQDYNMK